MTVSNARRVASVVARGAMLMLLGGTILVGCRATEAHRSMVPIKVASYDQAYSGPRIGVTVGQFQNKSPYMNGLFADGTDRLGLQAKQILKTHLGQTGRFDVLDRANLAALAEEARLSGRVQSVAGSQVLITGAVTEFGRREVGGHALGGVLAKNRVQVAQAKVSVQVVDVATSRTLFSAQGAGEYTLTNEEVLGFGSSASYDATLNDKVLNLAVIEVVNRLVDGLERNRWMTGVTSAQP